MNRKEVLISIILFTAITIVILIVLNPSSRFSVLSIAENEWNNIQKSRSINEEFMLDDIEFNGYKLIIDNTSDTLYYSLINNSFSKYNPYITYKTNKNAKLAFLKDDITDEKVKEKHEFKVMIYTDFEYHVYSLICMDLPLLNIEYTEDGEKDSESISMKMYLFNNFEKASNRITISEGVIEANIDDSYKFSLNMITPGKNIRDNRISILNMNPDSEYTLIPISSERMNVKEEKEKQKEKPKENQNNNKKQQRQTVELFINSIYQGAYYLE